MHQVHLKMAIGVVLLLGGIAISDDAKASCGPWETYSCEPPKVEDPNFPCNCDPGEPSPYRFTYMPRQAGNPTPAVCSSPREVRIANARWQARQYFNQPYEGQLYLWLFGLDAIQVIYDDGSSQVYSGNWTNPPLWPSIDGSATDLELLGGNWTPNSYYKPDECEVPRSPPA